jgi:hypothetical protein
MLTRNQCFGSKCTETGSGQDISLTPDQNADPDSDPKRCRNPVINRKCETTYNFRFLNRLICNHRIKSGLCL